jgi:hypothetical protein
MVYEPIEETYFNWLYSKVARVDNPTPSLTYYTLLRDFHSYEFVWNVIGDDNRAEDGLDVRREFLAQVSHEDSDVPWMHPGCSVLEMLIALSRKCAFQTEIDYREWFWIFLDNLGVGQLSDAHKHISRNTAEALDRLVWRTYEPNGLGGLFPLRHPAHDQRKVEIWYQFCEYLIDHQSD